jgi:hypothetical protein
MKININELTSTEKAAFILDLFHRTTMHNAMWFAEAVHQYGREKAYNILQIAYKQSYGIQLKRLTAFFGGDVDENKLPVALINMPDEQKSGLLEALSVNWLANDGVWFQAIESTLGMTEAKRCNDSAWANFSPFEAMAIKQFLGMPEQPGLEGLKTALQFRLYAFINKQSIANETENSFEFYMNECRVQVARKRKGLEDYPCKSGGLIEYSSFARTIDKRINTECISCPPDKHPDTYYCGWRFTLNQK